MQRKPLEFNRKGKVKITETMIRGQINDYLKLKGIFHWHNLQGLGCYRGLPDIEGVYKNRHFYIEAKRPGGSQSCEQEVFQRVVEREGEIYLLAANVDIVMEKLNSL